jgi:hypothetical protein
LLLLPLLARAEVGFEELAQLVESPVELQGSFVQQKYLAALDTSLESSGRFSFRRDESIRWEILQPIQNELVITPAGLSSRQGDDELLRIDASSNPGAALMGEIMFAVLSARWQRLAQYFDLSADIDGERWLASLRPRDAMIGQLFERVELRGAKCLEAIVLYEKGGDRTAIQLQVSSE